MVRRQGDRSHFLPYTNCFWPCFSFLIYMLYILLIALERSPRRRGFCGSINHFSCEPQVTNDEGHRGIHEDRMMFERVYILSHPPDLETQSTTRLLVSPIFHGYAHTFSRIFDDPACGWTRLFFSEQRCRIWHSFGCPRRGLTMLESRTEMRARRGPWAVMA